MELARRLLAAGVVSPPGLALALRLADEQDIPLALALVHAKVATEADLEAELAVAVGAALPRVHASAELAARLPPGAARRLGVVPLRRDPVSGVVDVAAIDPLDAHVAREVAFLLGEPVRVLRARFADLDESLRRLDGDGRAGADRRLRCHTPASPHGAPLSWRPELPEEPPPASPIPLVRRSLAPGPDDARALRLPSLSDGTVEHDSDGAIVLPLRAPKAPSLRPPESATGEERPQQRPSQRPSIVVDVPPPRVRSEDVAATPAAAAASSGAPRSSAGRTLVPPGPLAAPAPTGEGAPRLRDPMAPGERPDTLDALAMAAEGLVVEVTAAAAEPAQPVDDFGDVLALVRRAPSRDAVIDRVHRGLSRIARRTAVFAVRRDGYVGWTCNEDFGDAAALRSVLVSPDAPSLFRTAGTTAVYLGPVPETPAHEGVLRVMGSASRDVAAVSVRVAGRPVMVLLVDELADSMSGTRRMDELARAAGEALARLLGTR